MIVHSSLLFDFRRLGISVGIYGLGLTEIYSLWINCFSLCLDNSQEMLCYQLFYKNNELYIVL